MTAREAARRLGIHVRTFLRRVEAGEIPYVRKLDGPSGALLFDAAVIDLLAAQNAVTVRPYRRKAKASA